MAIRMARAFTGKFKVIKFEHHFHGWSDYLVAGSEGIGGIPEETLSTMIVLPPNDIETFERTLQENDDIAAVILEPTGAHMGLEPILPEFLQQLREVTEREGVVLIFDEVVTGFRTSRGGAQEYFGIRPDLTTLAKILGGGLPGGAVTGRAEIINMIEGRPGDAEYNRDNRIAHNGTFNANPISARGWDRGPRDRGERADQRYGQRPSRPTQGGAERRAGQAGDPRLRRRHNVAAVPTPRRRVRGRHRLRDPDA